jgi:hypothetical protein
MSVRLGCHRVLAAVDFNYELADGDCEVCDVLSDRMLSPNIDGKA